MEGQSCAVVCTSTASLEVFPNKPSIIHTLPLNIHTAQGDYRDGIDISSQQFYQYLQKHPSELPYTSPPDFDKAVALFLKLKQEDYTDVIVPTLSAGLSQTYKVIQDIASLMRNQINIHVIDTGTISILEGLFSLEAARLLEKGISPLDVVQELERLKQKLHLFFEVDSLKYLIKNGRISAIQGVMGSIMKLKPIIHFHNGKMNVIAKVRHTQNALEYLSEEVRKRLESSQKAKLFGLYAGDKILYQEFEQQIRRQTNELIHAYPISPVVGAHIGLKAVGIGMWLES